MLGCSTMLISLLGFLLLLQLGDAKKPTWENGPRKDSNSDRFQISVSLTGHRYQTGKHFWAFAGDDAIVTNDSDEAAWFYFADKYLKSSDKYVTLDGGSGYSGIGLSKRAPADADRIGVGREGNLSLKGDKYTVGKGEGIFCTSEDWNVFVVSSKRPSFKCRPLDCRPNGKSSFSSVRNLVLIETQVARRSTYHDHIGQHLQAKLRPGHPLTLHQRCGLRLQNIGPRLRRLQMKTLSQQTRMAPARM
jgi:hypothetical protein